MVFLGVKKNTKMKKKTLKTGKYYHVTGTLGSNLTYLATSGQDSMGVCQIVHSDPRHAQKTCPQEKNLNLAMLKRMVSTATHNAILLDGGVPTKQPYLSCFSV